MREHNNVRHLLQNTAVCRHLTEHAPCPSSLDGLAWASVLVGLRGMFQSTPMLTVLFLSSFVCCYSEHSSCFLLFSNFSATASSFLQTGAFGAWTRSKSILFPPWRPKEGCIEQPQPGLALCLFRTPKLDAYICLPIQVHTTSPESIRQPCFSVQRESLWADGCSGIPTNGMFCSFVCVCVWVHMLLCGVCMYMYM